MDDKAKRKKLRTRKHLDEIRRKSHFGDSERITSEKTVYETKPKNIFTSKHITLPTKAVCSKTVNRTTEIKKLYKFHHEKLHNTNSKLFKKCSANTDQQILNYSDIRKTSLKSSNMKHTNSIDSLSSPISYDYNNYSIVDNSGDMIDDIIKHGIPDISDEDVMENNRLAFFAIIQNHRNSKIKRNIFLHDHEAYSTSMHNIIFDHVKDSPKHKFLKETESSDNNKSPGIFFNVNITRVSPILQQTPECVYYPHKLNH